MNKKAFTIKIDESLLSDFKTLTKNVGITPTAAITMFMMTSVKEKKIPLQPKINK